MQHSEHELSHPFLVNHPDTALIDISLEGDVAAWLIRLEVYTPFDADRIRDLERWRSASAREHAEAFQSLLSVVDAMQRYGGEEQG